MECGGLTPLSKLSTQANVSVTEEIKKRRQAAALQICPKLISLPARRDASGRGL